MCPNALLKEIENCRKDMVHLASTTSLSNKKVIEVSTKLDELLYRYQTMSEER